MSAVYFVQEADRGVAVWRASDDAPDVFLCSVDLTSYHGDSQVRDRFAELVNVAADHCRREHAAQVVAPASRLEGIPCNMRGAGGGRRSLSCRADFRCGRA